MMMFKKTLASAAVAALLTVSTGAVAAPTNTAAANPAASLSLSKASGVRAGAKTTNANHFSSTIINIGILAALVVIVLVATSSGDDSPSSN